LKPTRIKTIREFLAAKKVREVLLICGFLAPLLFIGTDLLAGTLWKGYGFTSQSISELSAIGSPIRSLVVPLNLLYEVLLIAFGLGIWGLARQKRPLRIMAVLLVGMAIIDLVATFFPMHPGEALSTFPNTMNVILKGTGVLFFLLAIGFGAAAFRNWFRLYSIGTLLTFIVLTILGIWVLPQITAGAPISRVGIQERVMGYGCLAWVLLLAMTLLRGEKKTIINTQEKKL
jgi:hypothetical protein